MNIVIGLIAAASAINTVILWITCMGVGKVVENQETIMEGQWTILEYVKALYAKDVKNEAESSK